MHEWVALAVAAQVSIGGGAVRTGGVTVDATGVHTGTTDVDASGVHARGAAGTVIRDNGHGRTVNCSGGALTVDGNSNVVEATNCRRITLNGNGNVLNARFAAASALAVTGNHNQVNWSAPAAIRVGVSDVGTGNMVVRR